jgi:hypothetical protein
MATNMLAYKGIKKRKMIWCVLCVNAATEMTSLTPLSKWKNKDLVQALMKSDMEREGDSMEDAVAPDDKVSGDKDSEDDSSNNEGDNEETADNTTAFGFLKLLEVNIDTSETRGQPNEEADCDSNFNLGTVGSDILDLKRQSQI